MLAIVDPGDEVIVFEPYYENYGPDAILSGAVPRYVTLHEPDWSIDPDELRAAFGPRTRGIVMNSPHNPTGKVFTRTELELIAELCDRARRHRLHRRHLRAHRVRGRAHPAGDDAGHVRPDGLDPLDVQVVLGHRLAGRLDDRAARSHGRHPPVHDFLTVGAAAPLQAAAVARCVPAELLRRAGGGVPPAGDPVAGPQEAGFRIFVPAGAYYVMTDIRDLTDEDDVRLPRR